MCCTTISPSPAARIYIPKRDKEVHGARRERKRAKVGGFGENETERERETEREGGGGGDEV